MKQQPKNPFETSKDASLLTQPITDTLEEKAYTNRVLPPFLEKIEASGDDRSYVIFTALVAEHYVDRFLRNWIPGYDTFIKESKGFTFSLKIGMAKAFGLIPPKYFRCVDLLRDIRNKFAHNLTIDSLESLDQNSKDKIIGMYRELYGVLPEGDRSVRALFRGNLFVAICGVQMYCYSAKAIREAIESQDFLTGLANAKHRAFLEEISGAQSEAPIKTYIQDNRRYDVYTKGVVKIINLWEENQK